MISTGGRLRCWPGSTSQLTKHAHRSPLVDRSRCIQLLRSRLRPGLIQLLAVEPSEKSRVAQGGTAGQRTRGHRTGWRGGSGARRACPPVRSPTEHNVPRGVWYCWCWTYRWVGRATRRIDRCRLGQTRRTCSLSSAGCRGSIAADVGRRSPWPVWASQQRDYGRRPGSVDHSLGFSMGFSEPAAAMARPSP